MNRRTLIILLILTAGLTACPFYGYKYNTGVLPTSPVNIEDFNTEYDDYNLSAPTINQVIALFYSSNRKTGGGNFDIIHEDFEIQFDKDNAELVAGRLFSFQRDIQRDELWEQVLETINTSYNELGPLVTYPEDQFDAFIYDETYQYLFLWASDPSGDLDILFTHIEMGDSVLIIGEPAGITYLNSESNDAYPSIDFDNKEIYFCSDRGTDFDMYCCELPADQDVLNSLGNQSLQPGIRLCAELSSSSSDKCPSITENVLVFASDRPGGQGGYDLWYSLREGSGWSEPINFGKHINTEYDEYRPIIKYMNEFQHNLLMFSSNRPGGKGGFDLYFVGVKKLVERAY